METAYGYGTGVAPRSAVEAAAREAFTAVLGLDAASGSVEPEHLQAVVEGVPERNKVASEAGPPGTTARARRDVRWGQPQLQQHAECGLELRVAVPGGKQRSVHRLEHRASSIDEIVASTVRASDLVKRLHHAVRSEGEQPQEPVDLNEIVRDTVNTTRLRWQDETGLSGVTVEVLLELETVRHVRGTLNGLNEILTNLLLKPA